MQLHLSPLSLSVLTIISSQISFANNQTSLQETSASANLNTIVLEAEQLNDVGKTVYTEEQLKSIPNSSKNLTDFLKVNPNVQFGRDQDKGGNQGELKPAEISINGAQTFQNNFLVNGVSNNQLINPASSGGNAYNGFSTGAQGMAVNTDLLCELEVLDSNVSAEYGDFTGGVISAKTCAPKSEIGKIHGNITYDYTSSDWARFNYVNPIEEELFEEPSDDYQSEFQKQGISANLYSKLSEKWGANLYGSKRQSIIPVISGFDNPKKIDQEQNNSNAGITLFYTPSDTTKAKFGVDYGLIDNLGYTQGRRNSGSNYNSESFTTFAEIEHKINNLKLTHKLNYQQMNSERDSENNYGYMWKYAEGSKDWTDTDNVSEGSILGDLQLDQSTYSYSLKGEFDPFKFKSTTHKVSFGASYDHNDVAWKRPEDVYMSNTAKSNLTDLAGQSCLVGDLLCDPNPTSNGWNGQYFIGGTVYKAGEFEAQQDKFNLFLEDEMTWKNLSARIGVRADYDSLSSNYNISPRTNITYKPFGNNKLKILSGWNRYYGSQTLGTELNDAIAELQNKMSRSNPTDEWVISPSSNSGNTRRSDLDTPFTDEFVLGINSRLGIWDFGLKWVNRDFNKEISRIRTDIPNNGFNFSYQYANDGKGSSDIYTLAVSNHTPLQLFKTSHKFTFGFDYSEIFRSYTDYNDNYLDADQDQIVRYNGQIMRWSERPAVNFNQPWTARLNWDIQFQQLPLRLSNYFSYKAAYDNMLLDSEKFIYEGEKIKSYSAHEIKPRFVWNIRGEYDLFKFKDYSATLGVTVNNVTNHKNTYASGLSSTKPQTLSEIGRQYFADIQFKF